MAGSRELVTQSLLVDPTAKRELTVDDECRGGPYLILIGKLGVVRQVQLRELNRVLAVKLAKRIRDGFFSLDALGAT